ncbi:MAG: DUF427 domain-containing protein [Actinomycetota bacterium]|nr:DUF427 domain-containing protein [Actinomycetota bacterium]
MSGYPQAITTVDHVEPVPRRIRAALVGQIVLDTTRALYLWEWPHYPQYHIPADDVDPDALVDEQRTHRLSRGAVASVGLRAGEVHRAGAGRRYLESTVEGLTGTIRFDWDALDAWYEEDERVFVHPRSPYVRVDALRSTRRVRVQCDGVVLAESGSPVMVFETGLPTRYYMDRSALDFAHLRPSETATACPYKGRTTVYWSAEIGERLYTDLAWSYDFPTRQLLPIAGLVSFYNEKVDVFIDGDEQPRPQTHFST